MNLVIIISSGNKLEAEIKGLQEIERNRIKMPAVAEADGNSCTRTVIQKLNETEALFDQKKMKTDYIEQLHRMCALLYAANTNIDYFPTNFVVNNEEIYYVDFECNDYMEEWNFENWGVKYWSKTPEFLQYVKEHS